MTIRTTPIQARSEARIAEVLDACAAVIDEVGIEHVTTNLVAERAGCSIGTIYRYFPDRIAVLRALGLRQCAEIRTATRELLATTPASGEGYAALLRELAEHFLAWHRTTPGSSAICFAHLLDTPVSEDESAIVRGALEAGPSPRDQISLEVASHFVRGEAERMAMKRELDFVTVVAVAIVDRAGARVRSGGEGEEAYEQAAYYLGRTVHALGLRYDDLVAGIEISESSLALAHLPG